MNLNKKLFIFLFIIAVIILAVGVWYSPILFKGYSFGGISKDIILARNYSQAGVLADQNNLNIVLSSDLIKEKGSPVVFSQHMGSFFYAQIFKLIGIPNHNNLILLSIFLYAIVLVLFTILTLYLFNLKTAAVFSLIYIFSPLGWGLSQRLGAYEFCLIFWTLSLIFYFIGLKKTKLEQHKKINNIFFIFSGFFLALSSLSSEITLVFALIFFVFLLIKKLKTQLLYIFIPFAILLITLWAPSVINGENKYLSHLLGDKAPKESISSTYLHVFPDPYTYHFEKEEFLENIRQQDLGWSENLETKKILTNFGFEGINIIERIRVGIYILSKHAFRFFSLQEFGGTFILLLFILGIFYITKKNKLLYQLTLYWIIGSVFVFSFVILVSRNHLMDFIWPLMLGTSIGLIYLLNLLQDHFKLKNKKGLIFKTIVIGLVLYNFLLINHIVLGEKYENDFVLRSMAYAEKIQQAEVLDEEVIAIPEDFPSQIFTLNYLTDKSFVVFKDSTLNKLLNEGKIKQAFESFGVKYILGYSDSTSNKILSQTGVVNIASNSLEIDFGGVSENKSFFMNLVR